jgi:methylthioribose-1-phosphate isomerase
MKQRRQPHRTIWIKKNNPRIIEIIDQRYLPHRIVIEGLKSLDEMVRAIKDMHLRGAPLIGVAAAYGMYLACLKAPKNAAFDGFIKKAAGKLRASRPTAVNLEFAVERVLRALEKGKSAAEKTKIVFDLANQIAEEEVDICRRIGEHGLRLIEEISRQKKGKAVNILTHCNAGWLACVEWGTATAPIYKAFQNKIPVHIWVDETRPRNQGASLTAWELGQRGVPHTVIADNAGGHLMQHGMVDLVIVGSDRTTYTGDVANKIGTYLKALAAKDNHVPFYVALPSSTIDWKLRDGVKEIPIEERNADEVKYIEGICGGKVKKVLLTPKNSPARNFGFDVTPRALVTGLMTERGICEASEKGILGLFPERKC